MRDFFMAISDTIVLSYMMEREIQSELSGADAFLCAVEPPKIFHSA